MFIVIFILMLLGLLYLPYLLIRKANYRLNTPFDYLLVLGYPCEIDGALSDKQQARIASCIHYMNITGCRRIILSGGAVQNEFTEADAMAQALAKQCNSCIIETETKAKNTFQNFQYTKQIYGKEHILVITSAAHARRAYFFAKKFYSDAVMATVETDPLKEYIMEYFRLWNVLYWEVRLRLLNKHWKMKWRK